MVINNEPGWLDETRGEEDREEETAFGVNLISMFS